MNLPFMAIFYGGMVHNWMYHIRYGDGSKSIMFFFDVIVSRAIDSMGWFHMLFLSCNSVLLVIGQTQTLRLLLTRDFFKQRLVGVKVCMQYLHT